MKEYETKCPHCLRIIIVRMRIKDKRRNTDNYFIVKCRNCKRQWYARIFEKIVVYPHMIDAKEL